jgi:hypothetical protein
MKSLLEYVSESTKPGGTPTWDTTVDEFIEILKKRGFKFNKEAAQENGADDRHSFIIMKRTKNSFFDFKDKYHGFQKICIHPGDSNYIYVLCFDKDGKFMWGSEYSRFLVVSAFYNIPDLYEDLMMDIGLA